MIKSLTILFFTFSFTSVFSQQVQGYDLGREDLVIFPMGMNQKVTIGSISKNGISFDWDNANLERFDDLSIYGTDIKNALMFLCYDDDINTLNGGDAKVVKSGDIYVWKGHSWMGDITNASSASHNDYLLDDYANNANKGYSIQFFWVSEPITFKAQCQTETSIFSGGFKAVITYDLKLLKGWNMVKKEILAVQQMDEAAGVPTKISYTSVENTDGVTWFFKSF